MYSQGTPDAVTQFRNASYQQIADHVADGRQKNRNQRSLSTNYLAVVYGDEAAIRLHSTDIYVVYKDGTKVVTCGGWGSSVMTRAAIWDIARVSIHRLSSTKARRNVGHELWFTHPLVDGEQPYYGKLTFHPDGSVEGVPTHVNVIRTDPEKKRAALAFKRERMKLIRVQLRLMDGTRVPNDGRSVGGREALAAIRRNPALLPEYVTHVSGRIAGQSYNARLSLAVEYLFGAKNATLYSEFDVHYDVRVSVATAKQEVGF